MEKERERSDRGGERGYNIERGRTEKEKRRRERGRQPEL